MTRICSIRPAGENRRPSAREHAEHRRGDAVGEREHQLLVAHVDELVEVVDLAELRPQRHAVDDEQARRWPRAPPAASAAAIASRVPDASSARAAQTSIFTMLFIQR